MSGVRLIVKDHQWERMAPHLPGKKSDPGRTGGDNRLFVEAVLWVARVGSPWRGDVWDRLFAAMADDPDFEYVMIDSTIVRAHQHAAGKKGGLKLVRSAASS